MKRSFERDGSSAFLFIPPLRCYSRSVKIFCWNVDNKRARAAPACTVVRMRVCFGCKRIAWLFLPPPRMQQNSVRKEVKSDSLVECSAHIKKSQNRERSGCGEDFAGLFYFDVRALGIAKPIDLRRPNPITQMDCGIKKSQKWSKRSNGLSTAARSFCKFALNLS